MSLYSDRWLPKTGELNQNLRNFEGERLVLFEEEKVYDQLIADGRFPDFSNAFLIIVGEDRRDLPDLSVVPRIQACRASIPLRPV